MVAPSPPSSAGTAMASRPASRMCSNDSCTQVPSRSWRSAWAASVGPQAAARAIRACSGSGWGSWPAASVGGASVMVMGPPCGMRPSWHIGGAAQPHRRSRARWYGCAYALGAYPWEPRSMATAAVRAAFPLTPSLA